MFYIFGKLQHQGKWWQKLGAISMDRFGDLTFWFRVDQTSDFDLRVCLRYRKHQFSNWFDFPGNSSNSYLFLLLLLLFPGAFLSGELSTPVWRTVHWLQAVQPWDGYKTGSQIKASPGLDIKLAHYYCLRKTDSTVNTVRVPEQYCKQ